MTNKKKREVKQKGGKERNIEGLGWSRIWVEREERGCKGMEEIKKIIIKNKIKK